MLMGTSALKERVASAINLESVLARISNLFGVQVVVRDLEARRRFFDGRQGHRYWWSQRTGNTYLPDCYAVLSESEWQAMRSWFEATDEKQLIGECQIPLIAWLTSFVSANYTSRIVQLGTYAGYSTLLLGWTLRRMGKRQGLFAVDIDPMSTEFTKEWIARAGIGEQATLVLGDSAEATMPRRATEYLGGAPQIVFIDSSHQYAHTIEELDLWFGALAPGGMILMHDTSEYAATFDSSGAGGVRRALEEWRARTKVASFNLSYSNEVLGSDANVYKDGCGLGIILKDRI